MKCKTSTEVLKTVIVFNFLNIIKLFTEIQIVNSHINEFFYGMEEFSGYVESSENNLRKNFSNIQIEANIGNSNTIDRYTIQKEKNNENTPITPVNKSLNISSSHYSTI